MANYQSEGMDEYSPGTFDCTEYPGCLYEENGRCIFNIASIKQRTARACYEELLMHEHDYADQFIQ